MKKILEKKINVLIIVIAVLCVIALPVITNILGSIPTPITEGSTESWISFFGSYFGGILGGVIGALIAFGIAKYQIDSQKEYENKKMYILQLPTLIKVQLELDVIIKNLSVSKSVFIEKKDLPFPLDIKTDLRLNKINSDEYVNISNISDAELQADLIKLRLYHNSLVETMAFNFNENSIAIEKNNIEIVKLDKKKIRNRAEENKLQELIFRQRELLALEEMTVSNKEFSISKLEDSIKQANVILIAVEKVYKRAKEISAELNIKL